MKDNQETNIGLLIIGILIAVAFLVFGLFTGLGMSKDTAYKQGYSKGYHDARILYECEHDNAECEILKEEI